MFNNILYILIISVIAGIIASIIASIIILKYQNYRLRNIYKPLEGVYIRKNEKDSSKILAKARIEHKFNNIFKLKITTYINHVSGNYFSKEEIQEWTGDITMYSLRNGLVVWEYQKPGKLLYRENNIGFKRIIFSKDIKKIILFGEQGYGNEEFIRKED